MKIPKFITFTGLDDRTNLTAALELQLIYPIEYGILYSASNKDARYPSIQTFQEATEKLEQLSLHLCGTAARTYAEKGELPKDILGVAHHFNRIQVNGAKTLKNPIKDFDHILQCKKFTNSEHYQLYDLSGGRGQMPASVPALIPNKLVGYAGGGIGPETVLEYLLMINGEGEFWIDMEGRVRTNGWFDLEKVHKVCAKVFKNGNSN